LGCCIAFRRELLECALPMPEHVPHDMWLGLVGELLGSVEFLPTRLLRFRRHGDNASFAASRSRRSLLERVASRGRVVLHLVTRYPQIRKVRRTGRYAAAR
jgi:hypothetical protein